MADSTEEADTVTTPSGAKVIAHLPDGTEVNVTEDVQTLYDLVTGSMDWGSGFLTVEDALPVVHVAKICGFKDYEAAEAYVEALRKSEEQRILERKRREEREARAEEQRRWLEGHEHVYGEKTGKCVYAQCYAKQPPAFTAQLNVKDSDEPYRQVEWTMLPENLPIRVSINGPLTADVIAAFEDKIRREQQ